MRENTKTRIITMSAEESANIFNILKKIREFQEQNKNFHIDVLRKYREITKLRFDNQSKETMEFKDQVMELNKELSHLVFTLTKEVKNLKEDSTLLKQRIEKKVEEIQNNQKTNKSFFSFFKPKILKENSKKNFTFKFNED